MRKNRKEIKGLVRLRAITGREPTYECDNCHCKRYSPCGCKKKVDK